MIVEAGRHLPTVRMPLAWPTLCRADDKTISNGTFGLAGMRQRLVHGPPVLLTPKEHSLGVAAADHDLSASLPLTTTL